MMLCLWIVTSSLVTASFGVDVDFSIDNSCYSEDDNMKLTAVYTGSGTVTAVQWYYSGQSANNLLVLASTCNVAGGVPAGYPDISRMTFTCDVGTKTYTLTLSNLQNDDFDKSWGATFTLAAGSSPDVQEDKLTFCQTTTPPPDCECECSCKRLIIPCIIFCGLGIIILIVLMVLYNQELIEDFHIQLGLLVIPLVLLLVSIGLGAGVHIKDCCECSCSDCSCANDCCDGWVGSCATAFIVKSLLGIVTAVIRAVLIHIGEDRPDSGQIGRSVSMTHSRVHANPGNEGSLSHRADSDRAVSKQDVHVQENKGHLSGRPMPAIPTRRELDNKGYYDDDDHPINRAPLPERRAGALKPL